MIGWSAVGGAVLIGVVLLGFCVYELFWKAQRLRRDVSQLTVLTQELNAAQRDLIALSQRLRAVAAREH